MKKISLLFITAVMLLSMCACDKKDSTPATSTDLTDEELQQLIDEIEREKENQDNS